ncbi:MAG: hypothetical protein QOK02_3723 [Mycobacterium sp.]|jgi:hypothetical protein|nr:hypothetical protein [Mycobacterium sp.]
MSLTWGGDAPTDATRGLVRPIARDMRLGLILSLCLR